MCMEAQHVDSDLIIPSLFLVILTLQNCEFPKMVIRESVAVMVNL